MKIIIVSNNDWDGLWYQRQQFASMYAQRGHKVLFINKTLQRSPHIKDFTDRFFKEKSVTKIRTNVVPENVEVKTIYTLPPYECINYLNKALVSFYLKKSDWVNCDLLITYIPTYTALDIIQCVHPQKTAYINVHNYDADIVLSDLLKSERILCNSVNYLFGDSVFNIDRLKRISSGKSVGASEPGVNTRRFVKAYRGDESQSRKSICYFGGIGNHLDFSIYNALAEKFRVIFVGKFNDKEIINHLSRKIEVLPPVSNDDLPRLLKRMDIMGLFYKKTAYVNGVIPAKIYECIATLKPVLTSGMDNVKMLDKSVYLCDNATVFDVIENLPQTESLDVLNLKKKIAEEADWENRFDRLNKSMGVIV